VDRLNVLYFLEDRAQEQFLTALVERIALDLSIPGQSFAHDVRSARRGSGVLTEFRDFAQHLRKMGSLEADMIVVAVDGNCSDYGAKAKQLTKCVRKTDLFADLLVLAIPDPHIERWYLLDQGALIAAVGLSRGIAPPARKCKRDYYKSILRDALREQGVNSLLGGSEFGADIARKILDLYAAGRQDRSFERFVGDMKAILRRARPSPSGQNPASCDGCQTTSG
jgi:hypothetical protein